MTHATDAAYWTTAARIYNSAVAAWAISAAWELGALDELHENGLVDADEFAARHQLDAAATVGMFRALAVVDVVKRDDKNILPSTHFVEIYQTRSFFHWLTRGCGELFRQMPSVLRRENRTGTFYQRDAEAVAYACREISAITYDRWFWAAVDGLGFHPALVADLACGSGERLIQLLQRYPGARGVGIDIAPDALRLADAEAAKAGLADRLTFIEADMLAVERCPEFAEVELLTCFMAGHDLWPREQCIRTLARLRDAFPKARRLLLGDATRTVSVPDDQTRVFTLGFEFGHDLMGTFIPTVADWESVFEPGGWRVHRTHSIDMVVGETIFELGPR